MQVFANVPMKSLRSVRGHRQSNYYGAHFNAVRLLGPVRESIDRGSRGREYIYADIEIPEDVRPHVSVAEFRADDTVRVLVWVNTHRKTLAAFLASGDLEWDVREMES